MPFGGNRVPWRHGGVGARVWTGACSTGKAPLEPVREARGYATRGAPELASR